MGDVLTYMALASDNKEPESQLPGLKSTSSSFASGRNSTDAEGEIWRGNHGDTCS